MMYEDACQNIRNEIILFSNKRFTVKFVTAVCALFLIKLRWPKKENFYDTVFTQVHLTQFMFLAKILSMSLNLANRLSQRCNIVKSRNSRN